MIRYVLIVVLAATVLGMTATALDHVSETRGQQAVESEIATVEKAALALFEFETVPPDSAGPQRLVTVEVPEESLTREGTETLRFERLDGTDSTRVTYSTGGATRETTIAAPIQHADGGPVEMGNWRGTQQFLLTLTADRQGDPVVAVEPYP